MITDITGLLDKVTREIKDRTDIAVVGLSGGADSTLTTLLCIEALGKENVFGVHMPYNNLDMDTFNSASRRLSNHLGIASRLVNIQPMVEGLESQFTELSTINTGNMRSRMRMVALYTTARHIADEKAVRVRVIGTGNLSEDFIGYDTKGGDALCDFFPIGTLFKSEVYQLLEYFRDRGDITEEMINRSPSAGLWDGQTDEEELGYTYNAMEPAIRRAMNDQPDVDNPLDQFVITRHFENKHKHEGPPVIELREFCD